jgi:hypothetical protein
MANHQWSILETDQMGPLANALAVMFDEAAGLPEPSCVTIYGVLQGRVHNEYSLQFPGIEKSQQALALWAQRFGGVITSYTHDRGTGPELWVHVTFDYHDVIHVVAFACIPLPEGATTAEQDSEPAAVTPF